MPGSAPLSQRPRDSSLSSCPQASLPAPQGSPSLLACVSASWGRWGLSRRGPRGPGRGGRRSPPARSGTRGFPGELRLAALGPGGYCFMPGLPRPRPRPLGPAAPRALGLEGHSGWSEGQRAAPWSPLPATFPCSPLVPANLSPTPHPERAVQLPGKSCSLTLKV